MSAQGNGKDYEVDALLIRGAHAEALQHALRELLGLVRRTAGYMEPRDQALVMHARAVLAESEGMP